MPGLIDDELESPQHEAGETPAYENREPAEEEATEPVPAGPGNAKGGIGNRTGANKAIPAQLQDMYQRIVLAGAKIMYSPEMKDVVSEQFKRQVPPWQKVGEGAVGLMGIILQQARPVPPPEIIVAATIELAGEVAEFFGEAGLQISEDDRKKALQFASITILQGLGAKPDQIMQGMVQGGQGVSQGA